jgi:hypothetical protein
MRRASRQPHGALGTTVAACALLAIGAAAMPRDDQPAPPIQISFPRGEGKQVAVSRQSPLGQRLLAWRHELPRLKFRPDFNTYAPGRLIEFSDSHHVMCHGSQRIVLRIGRGIFTRVWSAQFDPADPVWIEINDILDEAAGLADNDSPN